MYSKKSKKNKKVVAAVVEDDDGEDDDGEDDEDGEDGAVEYDPKQWEECVHVSFILLIFLRFALADCLTDVPFHLSRRTRFSESLRAPSTRWMRIYPNCEHLARLRA